MASPRFDHERLGVYQLSIEFVAWSQELTEHGPLTGPMRDQLDRATSSIPLNIAEGNGKSLPRDRCRFLEIARGSAFECAACLDVLVAREAATQDAIRDGKGMLLRIVSMLTSLIASVSSRTAEEEESYRSRSRAGVTSCWPQTWPVFLLVLVLVLVLAVASVAFGAEHEQEVRPSVARPMYLGYNDVAFDPSPARTRAMNHTPRSAIDIRETFVSGERSALEIVEEHLAAIAEREPRVDAFLTICSEEAVERARGAGRQAGRRRGHGAAGRGAGRRQGLHLHARGAHLVRLEDP